MPLAIGESDDPAQDHVDGSSEERRAQKREQALDHVRCHFKVGSLLPGLATSCISDGLD